MTWMGKCLGSLLITRMKSNEACEDLSSILKEWYRVYNPYSTIIILVYGTFVGLVGITGYLLRSFVYTLLIG